MAFYEPTILRSLDPNRGKRMASDAMRMEGQTNADIDAEKEIAGSALTMLQELYPHHPWQVRANGLAQLLHIQLHTLMDPTRFWTLDMRAVATVNDMKRELRRAGGELLERFGLRRKAFEVDGFLGARQTKRLWSRNDRMPEG